jgi:hypothetical protein
MIGRDRRTRLQGVGQPGRAPLLSRNSREAESHKVTDRRRLPDREFFRAGMVACLKWRGCRSGGRLPRCPLADMIELHGAGEI